jgi:V/A-type H+-transporting ATPase subunit E
LTYEELMGSIEATAAERMLEMKTKAAAEAEGIGKAAWEKAAGIQEEVMDQAKKKVAAEREKMLARVRAEARLVLLKSRHEVADRAFLEVEERVRAARASPSSRLTTRRLAEEALGLSGGTDLVLHVDSRDTSLFGDILRDLGKNCEILADIETAGGLTITTRDGRFLVTNTLESRLSRARDLMKGEVFSILYGG